MAAKKTIEKSYVGEEEDYSDLHYEDEHGYIDMAKSILYHVGNLRLVGDTGTGKSTLVHYMCKPGVIWEEGAELHEYSLSLDTVRQDLLASEVLKAEVIEDGKGGRTPVTVTKVRLGRIAQWLMAPRHPDKVQVCFLDEFNYANPGIMGIINSLADFRGSVYVPELADTPGFDTSKGEEPVLKRVPKKHLLIIGMNPAERSQYQGANAMNIAQLRRFESIWVDYVSEMAEIQLLDAVHDDDGNTLPIEWEEWLVKVARFTRDEYRANRLSIPLTTGNLKNYARIMVNDLAGDPDAPGKILDVIKAMYPEMEKPVIEGLRTANFS